MNSDNYSPGAHNVEHGKGGEKVGGDGSVLVGEVVGVEVERAH